MNLLTAQFDGVESTVIHRSIYWPIRPIVDPAASRARRQVALISGPVRLSWTRYGADTIAVMRGTHRAIKGEIAHPRSTPVWRSNYASSKTRHRVIALQRSSLAPTRETQCTDDSKWRSAHER